MVLAIAILSWGWHDAHASKPTCVSILQAEQTEAQSTTQSVAPLPTAEHTATQKFVNLLQHDLQQGILNLKDVKNFESAVREWQQHHGAPFPAPLSKATPDLTSYHSYIIYQRHIENHHKQISLLDGERILTAIQNIRAQHTRITQDQSKLHNYIKQAPSIKEQKKVNEGFAQAVHHQYRKLVQNSIIRGANVDMKIAITSDGARPANIDERTYTRALHLAAVNFDLAMVKTLLEAGADIEARNSSKQTALAVVVEEARRIARISGSKNDVHWRNGHDRAIESIQFFVAEGANINTKDNTGSTPLLWIARNQPLLELAQYNPSTGHYHTYKDYMARPITQRALGDSKLLRVLIQLGANPHATDSKQRQALHLAARHDRSSVQGLAVPDPQIAMQLIDEHHVDVNARDVYHLTPLHYAAGHNSLDIIQHLIQKGAAVDAQDRQGSTPLHLAVQAFMPMAIKALLQSGANPNVIDNEGNTPLHLIGTLLYGAAQRFQHLHVALYLVEHGADVKIKNKKGKTASQMMRPLLRWAFFKERLLKQKKRPDFINATLKFSY